ncbi:MAG: VWA domain-containing protein [Opitutaceae bacterium]|jgi:Ca-activated chloride channel family protein|nr:VWA domain-containing protein [Opitutaceae bacterium]
MSFLHPTLLWLLLVPAAALLLTLRAGRAAAPAYPKISHASFLPRQSSLVLGHSARSRRPLAAILALAFLVLALARPQGAALETPQLTEARDVLVAVDVSRSMLAGDVTPDRLSRARLLVRSLADELQGERLGLLPFAGTAFLQSPLSADYEIFRTFLDELGPDMIPAGGSDFTALLTAADEAFGPADSDSQVSGLRSQPSPAPAADRFLVVLSDGEAQDESWRPVAQKLAERGVRVLALGLGTAEGAMIPDAKGGLVKDAAGAVVLSRLEAGTLQELARLTDGAYRDASAWVDLPALLRDTVARGRAARVETSSAPRRAELFAWFLAPALGLLALSLLREFPVTPRQAATRVSIPSIPVRHASALSLFLAIAASLPAAEPAPPPPDPLVELVGRLSAAEALSAADLAAFAELTASRGETARARPDAGPFPEGAVRDALAAAAQGLATAPTAADWRGIRSRLEALLAPPPQKPNPDKSDEQKNEEPNKQDASDSSSKSESGQNQPPQQQDSGDPKSSDSDSSSSGAPSDQAPTDTSKPSSDALGDLSEKPDSTKNTPAPSEQPPPEDTPTQKAGGVSASGRPEGEKTESATTADPALALPQQRLDSVRRADAPARLYQLLQDAETPPDSERRAPGAPTRDW